MDDIDKKTIQDIKDYVNDLKEGGYEIYKSNEIVILSCFAKAIEFIEENSKLR